MLFLSDQEKAVWKHTAEEVINKGTIPGSLNGSIRRNLLAAFHFYIGTMLLARGDNDTGFRWIQAGAELENRGITFNTYLTDFLARYDKKLVKPSVCFADPTPYIHYTSVPFIKHSRAEFFKHCCQSLPSFNNPFRIMDIGCGNGALLAELLGHLLEAEKINGVGEILLIDQSPAMLETALKTLESAFSSAKITTINKRIQDCSGEIPGYFDVAMSSLAYHHMPVADKIFHLQNLRPHFDHFILFEMAANIDMPELFSPELALAVYQHFGRIIDLVAAFEGPAKVVQDCIDCFLMVETVSILTQRRGERSEYHALRSQWTEVSEKALGCEYTRMCESVAYSDEYLEIFTLHYGK